MRLLEQSIAVSLKVTLSRSVLASLSPLPPGTFIALLSHFAIQYKLSGILPVIQTCSWKMLTSNTNIFWFRISVPIALPVSTRWHFRMSAFWHDPIGICLNTTLFKTGWLREQVIIQPFTFSQILSSSSLWRLFFFSSHYTHSANYMNAFVIAWLRFLNF